jgi:hypothetical protein
MHLSDDDFREAYKPLHVPAHYDPDASQEEQVIYALGQVGEGSAKDVGIAISKIDGSVQPETFSRIAAVILKRLFDTGHIKGEEKDGIMRYNLSKITTPNDGRVEPDLPAPGLD